MDLLWFIVGVHIVVCPFTKVEESFNIQAMHDLIYHKTNLTQYDHLEFPGVVPRTFVGPVLLTFFVSPVYYILGVVGLEEFNKFLSQYLVRMALAACVLLSFNAFRKAVEKEFGSSVSKWIAIITTSQFHFMFYLSRPLPNVMVLPFVLLACSCWLKHEHVTLISLSAVAVIIFRFELAILLGCILLLEVFFKQISLLRVIKIGLIASLVSLICTVGLDSMMWSRLLWPEGEVFWFNSVLNKSSEWGTSPFFWYCYSALPRALGASLLFVPIGMILDKRIRLIVIPCMIYILVFSFLPHKELRFIMYTFPLLNLSAAYTCHRFWIGAKKSFSRWLLCVAAVSHIVINIFITAILLSVAKDNYPGGIAISKLHSYVPKEEYVHVYIDNLAAQTGVSRFTQLHDHWIYNKTENISLESKEILLFSHLLLEAKSKYSKNLKPFSNSHTVIDIVEGFSHVAFNYNSFPPIILKTKPMIFILKQENYKPPVKPSTKDNKAEFSNLESPKIISSDVEIKQDSVKRKIEELKTQLEHVKETNNEKLEVTEIDNTNEFDKQQRIQLNKVISKQSQTSGRQGTPTIGPKILKDNLNAKRFAQLNEEDDLQIKKQPKTLDSIGSQTKRETKKIEKGNFYQINNTLPSKGSVVVISNDESQNSKTPLKSSLNQKEERVSDGLFTNDTQDESLLNSIIPVNKSSIIIESKRKNIVPERSIKETQVVTDERIKKVTSQNDFKTKDKQNSPKSNFEMFKSGSKMDESPDSKIKLRIEVNKSSDVKLSLMEKQESIRNESETKSSAHNYNKNQNISSESSFNFTTKIAMTENTVDNIGIVSKLTKTESVLTHKKEYESSPSIMKAVNKEKLVADNPSQGKESSVSPIKIIEPSLKIANDINLDTKMENKEKDQIYDNPETGKTSESTKNNEIPAVTILKDTTVIYASRGKGTIAKHVSTLKKKATTKEAQHLTG